MKHRSVIAIKSGIEIGNKEVKEIKYAGQVITITMLDELGREKEINIPIRVADELCLFMFEIGRNNYG